MKKLLLVLVSYFIVSCKNEDLAPKYKPEVLISKITYTRQSISGLSKTEMNFVYKKKNTLLEKITEKTQGFSIKGDLLKTDEKTYSFSYNSEDLLSFISIVPKDTTSFYLPANYTYYYNNTEIDVLFTRPGEIYTLFDYDKSGKVIRVREWYNDLAYTYYGDLLKESYDTIQRSKYVFLFSEYKNPLYGMNPSIAVILGSRLYGLTITQYPVFLQSHYLDSYILTPGPYATVYKVLESKKNYPLRVESTTEYFQGLKVTMEYEYADL
jgi:hypothetical protein